MGWRRRSIAVGLTIAAACLGAVACAGAKPAATPTLPSLDQQVQDDMAAQSAFAWSSERPLKWADFQGTAPAGGDEGALTAYSVFYGVRCTGETFNFLAVAGFLPHSSWVKPIVVADRTQSERTLRHEQTHFDLTEVYTRRLRKAFRDLYEPCRRPTSDLDGLVTQYLQEEKTEQQRYDDDTRHGLVGEAQASWDHRVATDLTTLAGYGK